MLKITAIVALAILAVVQADVHYKDCGSVKGTIKSVDVSSCPTEPCQFIHNTTVNVSVDFTANADITKATTKVYGYVSGIKVPFPVPKDACQDMTCPISKGAAVTYKNSIFINPSYPKVSVVVQWEIHDQDDNMIICFNVPVQITG